MKIIRLRYFGPLDSDRSYSQLYTLMYFLKRIKARTEKSFAQLINGLLLF